MTCGPGRRRPGRVVVIRGVPAPAVVCDYGYVLSGSGISPFR